MLGLTFRLPWSHRKCSRCQKNLYRYTLLDCVCVVFSIPIECSLCTVNSLDGVRCYTCPTGAKCIMSARRATETVSRDVGTASPRTKEGYYLFAAPSSKYAKQCDPDKWRSDNPCVPVAEEMPGANVTDIINSCSILSGFKEYWTADRIFSCLSGMAFYTCEVRDRFRRPYPCFRMLN